jgi:DNA-binding NarL/FixJ family response regulator
MSIATPIRVLLVDDNTLVRQGLRSALQAYPNIQVVGEAIDGQWAVLTAARLQPTVVVMDINMSKMDGITATQLIKTQHPEIVVIGLSVDLKEYQLHAMRKAGAFDLIRKDNVVAELYGAIQRAVAAIQPVLMLEKTPSSDVAQSDKPPQTESMKEPKI